MGLLSSFFSTKDPDFKTLVEQGAVIVDVRSPQEFATGNIQGSVNIPLDQIAAKADMLLKKTKPVITCCRSGSRSEMAVGILKSAGIDAFNGGPWNSLKHKI